jgi:hypothetical protein
MKIRFAIGIMLLTLSTWAQLRINDKAPMQNVEMKSPNSMSRRATQKILRTTTIDSSPSIVDLNQSRLNLINFWVKFRLIF